MTIALAVEDVRDALRAENVIAAYAANVRHHGATYRLGVCPRCGKASSSYAIVVDVRRRTWGHYGAGKVEGGECYGDLLDLVAAFEGLDTRRDFQRVLRRAAEIAGVSPRATTGDAPMAVHRRLHQHEQREHVERVADEARRRRAEAEWHRLRRNHDAGSDYLRDRGLEPRRLIDDGHALYDAAGNICVRLHAFDDGALVTVVRRIIAPRPNAPKVMVPTGGTTRGTLCGRVQEIARGVTIVTEGVVDTLTAIQLWPSATVLGAAGAGQLAAVTAAAAPRVAAARGRLVLVPDGDDIGQRCAIAAGERALAAGLVMDATLLVLELPAHDLNDAHRAGWRP